MKNETAGAIAPAVSFFILNEPDSELYFLRRMSGSRPTIPVAVSASEAGSGTVLVSSTD